MRITNMTYGRLSKLADFENERLEVSATVEENEDPSQVFDQLKQWVNVRLRITKAARNLPSTDDTL